MADFPTRKPASRRRRWLRFSVRQLGLFVFVIAVCLTLAVRFGPHVRFRWFNFNGAALVAEIRATPTEDMPAVEVPPDWRTAKLNSVRLALPSEMAARQRPADDPEFGTLFADETIEVGVVHPTDNQSVRETLRAMVARLPKRNMPKPSMVDLRTEILQASADDFRWTLSPDELKWHQWRLEMSFVLRPPEGTTVEVAYLPTVHGMLFIRESSASYEWYTLDGATTGSIIFSPTDGHSLDIDFVRSVCQSLEYDDEE